MSPGGNSPWIIDNNGSGIPNGQYTDVALEQNAWNGQNMATIGGNSTNATFDVTVSGGIVTSVTLKQPGVGWIPEVRGNGIQLYLGTTGQLNIRWQHDGFFKI